MPVEARENPLSAQMQLLTGAEAAAHAMRQINPDVVSVYPITPQTPIIQTFAKFVADGEVDTEIINVESEHSAMSAAVGAAQAGARTMTATASQGLALMIEIVYIAASMRLPIVMAVGNRALSGPINIHCDHADSMLARDSGMIQILTENAQEAYDLMVIAPRLAEHPEVMLPVLVGQDGFTITHSAEPVSLLPDAEVRDFVGDYRIPYPLLSGEVVTQGPFAMPDYYFEIKAQQVRAMQTAAQVFDELSEAYKAYSGRRYQAVEGYRLDDADRALILMGSSAGTAKDVVDALRTKGEKVGLAQIRLFRPFPAAALREMLAGVSAVAVLDRALSFGGAPPLFAEVAAGLFNQTISLSSYVYGLGGRDLFPEQIAALFHDPAFAEGSAQTRFIGLRE